MEASFSLAVESKILITVVSRKLIILLLVFPSPNAQCPMPNPQSPIPNAQCPMPNSHLKKWTISKYIIAHFF
ncbi:MAG: hypothetical protein AAF630_15265 [Cyanobacteria bacterium P01_C01_bin.38]